MLVLYEPVAVNPSCLQTTWASAAPQMSSQTVPHSPLLQNSTRPSLAEAPPTSLRSPWLQIAGKG